MIIQQLSEQLSVLKDLLIALNDSQFTQKISFLNDATIGAHTRHIIELIQCLTNGYEVGNVDYINRERNLQIEQNKAIAIRELNAVMMTSHQNDKTMDLLAENQINESTIRVSTSYFREIEYNKEHTIHHLALIRVALREMDLKIVNDSFGVAHATLKYISKQQIMQA